MDLHEGESHSLTPADVAPSTAVGRLIDVEWDPPRIRRFRIHVVLLGVLVLGPISLIVVTAAYLAVMKFGWLAWVGIAALGVASFGLIRRIARTRTAKADGETRVSLEASGGTIDAAVAWTLDRISPGNDDALHFLTQHLVTSGYAGVAVRAGRRSSFPTIVPIQVPFEAVPYDEFDDCFESLASDEPHGKITPVSKCEADRSESPRTSRWWLRHNRWLLVIAITLFLLFSAGSIWRRRWEPLMNVLLIGTALLGVAFLNDLELRRFRLFFIPGGLLVRTPRGASCEVLVFGRDQSALVVVQTGPDSMTWHVSNRSRRSYSGTATPREAEMLLRCWLSPIEPPSVDRLTDLT